MGTIIRAKSQSAAPFPFHLHILYMPRKEDRTESSGH